MVKKILIRDKGKKIVIFTDKIASVEELDETNRYGARILLASGDWSYSDESFDEVMAMI